MRMSIKIIRYNICAKLRIIALGYVSSCFIKAHTNDFLINELKKVLCKNLNKPVPWPYLFSLTRIWIVIVRGTGSS